MAGVNCKTVVGYVEAAVAVGLDLGGGEEQLTDELIGQVAAAVRPDRPNGHGAESGLRSLVHVYGAGGGRQPCRLGVSSALGAFSMAPCSVSRTRGSQVSAVAQGRLSKLEVKMLWVSSKV